MCLMAQDLTVYAQDGTRLVGPLSLRMEPGARIGMVGESGSGKTLFGRALLGVLPKGLRASAHSLACLGHAIEQGVSAGWSRLSWVPQDPSDAFHPLLNVGEHLVLLPRAWKQEPPAQALGRLLPMLERLRLPTDRAFLRKYPHQMSGGQRQRLALVMALSCDPAFLVMDEPTTSLDAESRNAVLELIGELHRERGLGYLWISHDLELLAAVADQVLVIYGGEAMEAGPIPRVLAAPRTPYLARLLSAARGEPCDDPGFLEAPGARPQGCPFRLRCPSERRACSQWGPWVGTPEDGFRCEQPLREPALQD